MQTYGDMVAIFRWSVGYYLDFWTFGDRMTLNEAKFVSLAHLPIIFRFSPKFFRLTDYTLASAEIGEFPKTKARRKPQSWSLLQKSSAFLRNWMNWPPKMRGRVPWSTCQNDSPSNTSKGCLNVYWLILKKKLTSRGRQNNYCNL